MYAQEGLQEIEYDKIVREFATIVPFDTASQGYLAKDLAKIKDPIKLTETLQQVFQDGYNHREKQVGEQVMREIEVFVTLRTMDRLWMEHLDSLEDLRDGIGLRGYGQRDPLVEYKKEAFGMFEKLLATIDYEISRQILRIGIIQQPTVPLNIITQHAEATLPGTTESDNASPNLAGIRGGIIGTVKNEKKMGRNDPCWCGSGKKWKKCHYPQTG